MRNSILTSVMLASCLAVSAARGQDDEVVVKPISIGSVIDIGQIVHGSGDFDGVPIQRTTVWLQQAISIGPRLDVRAGLGSLFWYKSPPEQPGSGEAGRFKTMPKFGVGFSRADMEYRFGDGSNPMFTLQAGYFPYKYNPEARNLGEYLLRAGAYPGYLSTGGWNLISGGGVMTQGLRLNMSLWGGRFQSDFLLPMEQDRPSINGDLSPTYVASLTPVRGVTLGAGAACSHCIAVKPSRTSPELKPRTDGQSQTSFGYGNGYVIRNPNYNAAADSGATPTGFAERYDGGNPNANSQYMIDTTRFYSFKGVKLMARGSFDPKAYVALPMLGPEDLKIFGEVALLGVENRPFYYEKRTERMPVMFGVNLPTRVLGYTLLDVLSFQMEYYNSPFANTTRTSDKVNRLTTPIMSGYDAGGILVDDPNLFDFNNRKVTGDDWKWSVYAAREVLKGMRLHLQVANDHSRFPDEWARYSVAPATVLPKDWYYVLRVDLGI